MNNKKRNAVVIGIILVAVVIVLVALGNNNLGQNSSKSESQDDQTTLREQRNKAPSSKLSPEEANEIVAAGKGINPLYDMYEGYHTNNMLFLDPESPCNQGAESLQEFVSQFSSNVAFQRNRTRLSSEKTYLPKFGEISLTILEPDSVNYFAAWNEIGANEAAFCTGWLGSEMASEYVFTREDKDSPWYLVDYFSESLEGDYPL